MIEYRRADSAEPRPSDYRRVAATDAPALRDVLAAAYGTLVVVEKRRKLLLSNGVRIHLDEGAMRNAHAPYSSFKVAAALRTPPGGAFAGANVEIASYPEAQCAETSAIGAFVAAGERAIAAVAVAAERAEICPPRGGCRQRLAELGAPDTLVYLGRSGGPVETTTLGELLPRAFELSA